MITRIEIDGFKSFRDFAVDLRPLQVFIGPNGVGKSNLFDAIVLLSHLAGDNTLYDAFRKSRGEIDELFTVHPNGQRVREMSFAVEMLIGKATTDDLGTTAEVSSTRLRYELKIERREESGFWRLYVASEDLRPITSKDDTWEQNNISADARKKWVVRARGNRTPYISTEGVIISKHQDGRSGRRQERTAGRIARTILSTVSSAEYPTAYAARQEMLNWHFLQLDPVNLRAPSNIYSPTELLPDGSNLAAVFHRMAREDELAPANVSLDMANLVPGIVRVSVKPIIEREEFLIEAEEQEQLQLSSRVLSDGTLRLLALVVLKNDPSYQGVLCFEEPENGVHPSRLERIVSVLKSLTTDFEGDEEEKLKQVLVNTHSPSLLPYTPSESMLYVDMRTRMHARETWMIPVMPPPLQPPLFENTQLQYYTWEQVRRFLNPDPQREKLKEIGSIP